MFITVKKKVWRYIPKVQSETLHRKTYIFDNTMTKQKRTKWQQWTTNHYTENQKIINMNPTENRVEVWCFGRVCSSCSITGTRRFIRERKYYSYLSLIASLLHFRRIKWLTFAVSEWLLFTANSAISWREQVNFQWDDNEICFVLDHTLSWICIVLAHWNNLVRR